MRVDETLRSVCLIAPRSGAITERPTGERPWPLQSFVVAKVFGKVDSSSFQALVALPLGLITSGCWLTAAQHPGVIGSSTLKGTLVKSILKAVLFGALAAVAVFFVPFLPVLLMFALLFALLSRRWLGWPGGPRFAGPQRWGREGGWVRQPAHPVSIDGRTWQRAATAPTSARDVQVG